MPANFPEMWLNRVENNIVQNTEAPWLDGIPEIDTAVLEMGSGEAGELNVIHLPTSDFEPDVLINNTTYPLAVQAYADDSVVIQLDKFQTKPTSVSDDKIIGGSYSIIDNVTGKHTKAILKSKYMKAAHALAPAANTANTPIILTTGDGTEATGERLRFTYKTLVALKKACDDAKMPMMGRRLVLCSDHWNDFLLDRAYFADQMLNYSTGQVLNVLGFEIFQYLGNPYYNATAKTKLAFGATPTSVQYQGSFCFWTENVGKKTGFTKQYFQLASMDPVNQTNLLNYRHYYITLPKRNMYIAAIASATKA